MSKIDQFRVWEIFRDGSGFYLTDEENVILHNNGDVYTCDGIDITNSCIVEKFTGWYDSNKEPIYDGHICNILMANDYVDSEYRKEKYVPCIIKSINNPIFFVNGYSMENMYGTDDQFKYYVENKEDNECALHCYIIGNVHEGIKK